MIRVMGSISEINGIKYYEDTTITCEVTARTRYKLYNFDLWPLSVTLTFDIESCVLYAIRILMMLNISTKYHEDTSITCEVIARTRSDGRTHAHKKKCAQAGSTINNLYNIQYLNITLIFSCVF